MNPMWLELDVAPFSGASIGEYRKALVNANSMHYASVVKVKGEELVRIESAVGPLACKCSLAELAAKVACPAA
jgi:hypothetical protein